jgi:hypothetical protein
VRRLQRRLEFLPDGSEAKRTGNLPGLAGIVHRMTLPGGPRKMAGPQLLSPARMSGVDHNEELFLRGREQMGWKLLKCVGGGGPGGPSDAPGLEGPPDESLGPRKQVQET